MFTHKPPGTTKATHTQSPVAGAELQNEKKLPFQSPLLSPGGIAMLQRSVGNRAVKDMLTRRQPSSAAVPSANLTLFPTNKPAVQRTIDKEWDQFMGEQNQPVADDQLTGLLHQYLWEIFVNGKNQTFQRVLMEARQRSPENAPKLMQMWLQVQAFYHQENALAAVSALKDLTSLMKPLLEQPLPPQSAQSGAPAGERALIVQGAHMRGDMYGVAGALALRPNLCVVIIADHVHNKTAQMMEQFYNGVIDPKHQNVYVLHVRDAKKEYNDAFVPNKKSWMATRVDEFETAMPEIVPKRKFAPMEITVETKMIKDEFEKDPAAAHHKVKERWLGEDQFDKESGLQLWLSDKMGMPPGRYALLWIKTGDLTHPHAHHYTSAGSQQKLIKDLSGSGRTPVNIGDRLDNVSTVPDLTQFWNDPDFPYKAEGRRGQLRMLNYLAHAPGYDVVSVGMRSGILEGPALVGMKVIFLEEKGNDQASRWENLIDTIPGMKRVLLDAPPGLKEKMIWIDKVLWRNHKSEVLNGSGLIKRLEKLLVLPPNDITKILLDTAELPQAVDTLLNKCHQDNKIELKEPLIGELSQAHTTMNPVYEQKWKEEKLKSVTAKSEEGMTAEETDVVKQLLDSWEGTAAMMPEEAEANYWDRTRRTSHVNNSFDWRQEKAEQELAKRNKELQNLLETKKIKLSIADRDKVAAIRVEHPEFEQTASMIEFSEKLLKEIKRVMKEHVEPKHYDWLIKEINGREAAIRSIKYEVERLKTVDQADADVIFNMLGEPLEVLTQLGYDKELVTNILAFTHNNLLSTYNILRIQQKNIPFLPEMKNTRLTDNPLASGKQKDVYGCPDDPEHVIGLMNRQDNFKLIRGELDILHEIAKADPTLRIIEIRGITIIQDKPAVIMKRYAEHSKDFVKVSDEKNSFVKVPQHLNPSSIQQLAEIEKRMDDVNLRIKDLQFLIDEQGNVVIADPGGLQRMIPSKNERSVIDNLIATTVDKLLREADRHLQPWGEKDLAEEIGKLTSRPPADPRVKSVMKALKDKYKYNVLPQGSFTFDPVKTGASAPQQGNPSASDQKSAKDDQSAASSNTPLSNEEKIIEILKSAKDYLVFLPDGYGDHHVLPIFGMSKAEFDEAWKALKKKRKVNISEEGIRLSKSEMQKLNKTK